MAVTGSGMEAAVEAVARAIHLAGWQLAGEAPPRAWDQISGESREKFRFKARAALSAAKPILEAELADTVARLEKENERLKEAGRVVFQYSLIRPADGYEKAVADAAHVLYPTSVNEPVWAALDTDNFQVPSDLHADGPPHGPGGVRRCVLDDEIWPCSAILSERERTTRLNDHHRPRPLQDAITKRYWCTECGGELAYKTTPAAGWYEHV